MGIIYTIITALLVINFILVKKSKEKQNVLLWGLISIVLLLGYNTVICCGLTAINIKCGLISLVIINTVIATILGIKIYKDKEIQKYYIKIKDIIAVILILLVVIIVGVKRFGIPFNIRYTSTDPSTHYAATKTFTKNLRAPITNEDRMMPSAYINTGIAMLVASDVIIDENQYIVYILFDLLMLFLIGAVFYTGSVNKENSIVKSILSLILSIAFILGYPLNSMIFGFAYLSLVILYIVTLIVLAPYIKNGEITEITKCVIFSIINFGIFFSYYLFVPVIYSSFGIYMLIDMIKNKKSKNILSIFTIKNVIEIITILIIPTISGFCFFVLPGLVQTGKTMVSHIAAEGYIYRDLYSNFLVFIPLVLYYIIDVIKNKENKFDNMLLIITAVFTLYLLRKGLRAEASSYYYYKMYFMLWILVIYVSIESLFKLIDNKSAIYAYTYVITYICIIIASLKGIDKDITSINALFNPTNHLNAYTDIYAYNNSVIKDKINDIYTDTQIQVINDTIYKVGNKSIIQLYGNKFQILWARELTELTDTKEVEKLLQIKGFDETLEEWIKNENKKYLIILDKEAKIENETDKYKMIVSAEGIRLIEKK